MSRAHRGSMEWLRGSLIAVAACLCCLAAPSVAAANFEILKFGAGAYEADRATEVSQAGAHPNRHRVDFEMSSLIAPPTSVEDLKTVIVDLPPGFLGDPQAIARCSRAAAVVEECPPASQVGLLTITYAAFNQRLQQTVGLYNVEPRTGEIADFEFVITGVPLHVTFSLRPGDYGVQARLTDVSQTLGTFASKLTLWGTPASTEFDTKRPLPRSAALCKEDQDLPSCVSRDGEGNPVKVPVSEAPQVFLSNPTSCEGPLTTRIKVDSWQNPGVWQEAASTTAEPIVGCERLAFDPTMSIDPVSRRADAPTGMDVSIAMPTDRSPAGLAPAHLKKVQVRFPEGMRVNPASAAGLAACTDAQLGLGTDSGLAGDGCSFESQIGTASATSPALDEPLEGGLYVRPQASNDPESGEMLRLALVLRNENRGVIVKLPGQIRANAQTGRLEATFDDNPQLPVSGVQIHLDDGPTASLVTPAACGAYETEYTLTSWSGKTVSRKDPFTIDQGCEKAAQFAPGFEAGSADATAAGSSPFTLRVTRQDGEQNISRIDATLPEGLLAKLAGVPLCGEVPAASGNCPAASQIGSTTVGVGAGTNPLYVPQAGKAPTAVYLGGPYKGAPYSLVVKVPAQAGPFDLGTVSVRSAISIDPTSAQVSVKSDPLPQILQGIPIAYRDVRVRVDRPGFILNPTACGAASVLGRITSDQGRAADVSARFQVANCERLGFRPSLKLKVSGPTKRGKYPKLRAELKAPAGQANIGKVSVALPHSEFLAQEHIKTICTRVQYSANGGGGRACPKGSVYGWARAFTPLLDKPLEGPVYLRSSSNPLPDLVASLDGQIHIDLAGRIDSVNGGIRNTFEAVPDAPVSKFVLSMKGGKKSLLVNSRNLCATKNRATVKMDGQNGKTHDFRPLVGNSCGGKVRKARK